jgi:hypothetical protein
MKDYAMVIAAPPPGPSVPADAAKFVNRLRILMCIDIDEFVTAMYPRDVGKISTIAFRDWASFRDEPHRWVMKADDSRLKAIFEIIERREARRG